MLRTLLISKLLVFLLVSASFSQENVTSQPKHLALIDWITFENEKTGIKNYARAMDFAYNPGFIPEKDAEKRRQIYEESFKKRYKIVVEPIKLKISDLLRQIEIENNLIIFDGRELEEKGLLLAWGEKINITENVITFANDFFKTGVKPSLKLNLPETKFAVINTELFKTEAIDSEKKYKLLQNFAEQKGLHLILDSSLTLPSELNDFPKQDVTKDFITYYNQMRISS
jgi:hypothetical protein